MVPVIISESGRAQGPAPRPGRGQAPTIGAGDALDNHGGIVPTPMRLPTRLSGEDLWFKILLIDDAGAAPGGPYYEQTLFLGIDLRILHGFQPSYRPIDRSPLVTITGRELPHQTFPWAGKQVFVCIHLLGSG